MQYDKSICKAGAAYYLILTFPLKPHKLRAQLRREVERARNHKRFAGIQRGKRGVKRLRGVFRRKNAFAKPDEAKPL